ncbi:MAG: hypothetical protein ACRDO1_15210 [Nocardioidaceae bacterium]
MQLSHALTTLAAETEPHTELPMPALMFGVVALGVLFGLMVALLMFGKGRPHS